MADYLSNLIAKNLSPQEKIAPRLPARFEPSQEARLAGPVREVDQPEELSVEPEREPLMHEALRSPVGPSSEIEQPVVNSITGQQQIAHSHDLIAVPEPVRKPYRGRLDVPERVDTIREVVKEGVDGSGAVKAGPANTPETTEVVTTSELEPVSVVVKSSPGRAKEEPENAPKTAKVVTTNLIPSVPVRSNHFSGLDAVSSSTPHTSRPQAQQPPPAPAPEPPRLDLAPAIPPLPELAPRTSPPQPAPTIHVRIGRIEVRATTPPSPPVRKPSPASKVMSLDEYLQSRSNGGGS